MEKQKNNVGVEWILFASGAAFLLGACIRILSGNTEIPYLLQAITAAIVACAFYLGGIALWVLRK